MQEKLKFFLPSTLLFPTHLPFASHLSPSEPHRNLIGISSEPHRNLTERLPYHQATVNEP